MIEINTDQMNAPEVGDDLFQNRTSIVTMQQTQADAEVTILVEAYNRLEKTRRCISSILEYTKEIDYELILVDNGSFDGTLEYFRSISHAKKKILHVTHNIGALYPLLGLDLAHFGHFICMMPNDMIVTVHWLENLLTCIKSDPKIGMVVPLSSNTSNFQCVNLSYLNEEEMQQKASEINISNPQKWQERQRLITTATFYRKEALFAIGWPSSDIGFFHDFADDDVTFRIRRMGYKTILAGDTWVCHDHNIFCGEGKEPSIFQNSLEVGRNNFRDKYFGVDAWEDVNNFYIPYLSYFPKPVHLKRAEVLGIDVKCGTPILDLKNWLRNFSIYDTDLSAFTQDPKYWLDLKTICTGPVLCDREEFLGSSFPDNNFDYVVADLPVNCYQEPLQILNALFHLCKPNGSVVLKLLNAYSFREYLNLLGQTDVYNPSVSYNISVERFQGTLASFGEIRLTLPIRAGLNPESEALLDSLFPVKLPAQQRKAALERMQYSEYLFVVEKKG